VRYSVLYSGRGLPVLFKNIFEFLPDYTADVTSQKMILFIKWLSRVIVKTLYYLLSVFFQNVIFHLSHITPLLSERSGRMRWEIIYSCHVAKSARNPSRTFQGSVMKRCALIMQGWVSLFNARRWKNWDSHVTFCWKKESVLRQRKGFLPSCFPSICILFTFLFCLFSSLISTLCYWEVFIVFPHSTNSFFLILLS
jgi:hypothetical protein